MPAALPSPMGGSARRGASPDATHHLVLHAGEDDIQHLGERGLGGGLIDEVFAGQIDVVACPHCLQDGALMDFNVWGSHGSQKSLRHIRNGYLPTCPCFSWANFPQQLRGWSPSLPLFSESKSPSVILAVLNLLDTGWPHTERFSCLSPKC